MIFDHRSLLQNIFLISAKLNFHGPLPWSKISHVLFSLKRFPHLFTTTGLSSRTVPSQEVPPSDATPWTLTLVSNLEIAIYVLTKAYLFLLNCFLDMGTTLLTLFFVEKACFCRKMSSPKYYLWFLVPGTRNSLDAENLNCKT